MTKIVYRGPSPSVQIVGGPLAINGEPVEVDADLAVSLLAQATFVAVPAASTKNSPQEG